MEDLLKEVISKSKDEIEFLEKEFKKECDDLERDFSKNIEDYKSNLIKKQNIEVDSLRKSIIGLANKKSKEMILKTKSDLIREVITEVRNNLFNLGPVERREIYKNLLNRIDKEFNYNRIVLQRKDSKIIKEILGNKNVKLSYEDINGLELYNDSKEKIDLRFETLLDSILEDRKENIQNILFGN